MLSKSFKPGKCKTLLKLAAARIKLLRNKREVQVKQMKRDLAQLLETGQEQTARIRVEHVIREEKTMSAYDLIELYCELIVARLPIIESQKGCPIDLKEAICSVIFASPRCADIPELMDVRKHFAAKYGKEFINAALEVRPDCGVNRLVVEKLSARAPDVETKIKVLTAVAQEHNVKWDSKQIEEQLQKPHDDLLNGPNTFAGASKLPMESSNINSSPAPTQTNESSMKKPQSAATCNATSTFSHTNTRTPNTSVPFTSQPASRASERRSGDGEVENSYSMEGNASMNRPTWNMGFQDATSAAQAAAESAERASLAARAAVELASRGHMSRQNSTGSNESPTYSKKFERPELLRGLIGKHEHIVEETKTMANNELESSRGMKPEMQNRQTDVRMQEISRREAGRTNSDHSSAIRPPSRSSSNSSQADVKDYVPFQKTSTESEVAKQNFRNMKDKNVESDQENINVNSSKEASSHHASPYDDDGIWNSNIYDHQNDDSETSIMGSGGVFSGSNHKQPISSDYSPVVFDDYGSDADNNNSVFGRNKGNLLDSFQAEEPSSSFLTNIALHSPKQHRSGSRSKNSSSQLHLFKESFSQEHFETMTKVTLPSQSDDNVPVTFDDSDGLSTENEDEVANFGHKESVRPSNFLHNQRTSMRSSFSDKSGHGSVDTDSHSADKFWERSGSSSQHNDQPSPRNDEATSKINDSGRGDLDYSSTDDEEPRTLGSSKVQSTKEAQDKEKLGMSSTPFSTNDSEILNEDSFESGLGLSFGRLTGGFKNRGFPRPPYVRSSVADASHLSRQVSGDTSVTEKLVFSEPDTISEVTDEERYNQESRPKAYTSKSKTSGASIDSHSETAEGLALHHSAEDTPDMDGRRFDSREGKISEDTDVSSQESYYQRSRRKGYKEASSNIPGTYVDPDSSERPNYPVDRRRYKDSASTPPKQSSEAFLQIDKSTASTLANSGVLNQEIYDIKPHIKAHKESSSRMVNLDSDGSEAKLDSHYTAGSRVNIDVKLSRRTRDMPSEAKKSSSTRVTGHSNVPLTSAMETKPSQVSDTARDAANNYGKGSSSFPQSYPSTEQPSVAPKRTSSTSDETPKSSQLSSTEFAVPKNNGNTKPSSSSGDSVSREGSLKKVTHTHPKLPDYDSLAAHFHSLRSNQR